MIIVVTYCCCNILMYTIHCHAWIKHSGPSSWSIHNDSCWTGSLWYKGKWQRSTVCKSNEVKHNIMSGLLRDYYDASGMSRAHIW